MLSPFVSATYFVTHASSQSVDLGIPAYIYIHVDTNQTELCSPMVYSFYLLDAIGVRHKKTEGFIFCV